MKAEARQMIYTALNNMSERYTDLYKDKYLIVRRRGSEPWKIYGIIREVNFYQTSPSMCCDVLTNIEIKHAKINKKGEPTGKEVGFILSQWGWSDARIFDGDFDSLRLLLETNELE